MRAAARDARLTSARSTSAERTGAAGGGVFATVRIDDSFAVVDTGVTGLRVCTRAVRSV